MVGFNGSCKRPAVDFRCYLRDFFLGGGSLAGEWGWDGVGGSVIFYRDVVKDPSGFLKHFTGIF